MLTSFLLSYIPIHCDQPARTARDSPKEDLSSMSSTAAPRAPASQPPNPPKSSIHAALHSKARRQAAQAPETLQSIRESMMKRVNVVKEGDAVMLRLPSEAIKSVVVTSTG